MRKASPIRCLVTAGPTREFLDPVRFISNPSTGKMGFAIAEAAAHAGWTVDLVSGPVALKEPEDVIFYPVVTAEEMYHQVDALFDACDILIMTAAVSDFRPLRRAAQKEKKADAALTIEFERTIDILSAMTERKARQTIVGFAAETNDVETYARQKLQRKRLDWVVANDISKPGSGFGGDTNEALFIGADGSFKKIGPASKRAIAVELITLLRHS